MVKKYILLFCASISLLGTACLKSDAAPQVRRLGYIDAENSGDAEALAFSPGGKMLADAVRYGQMRGSDWHELGAVRLWNVQTGKRLRVLRPVEIVRSVAFSPDGKLLAAGLEIKSKRPFRGQVNIWNTRTWKLVRKLKLTQAHVYAVRFVPDGKLLAVGCGDSSVRLWDWKKNKITRVLRGTGNAMTSLAISPNGRYLVAGSFYAQDKSARLWEVSTGRALHTWQHQGVVAFSPDSKTVATAEVQRESEPYPLVRLWDVASGKLRKTLVSRGTERAESLAFSPNGNLLAVNTGGGTGYIWDLRQSKITQELKTTTSSGEITFSPDGKLLAEAGSSSAVYLHRVINP